MPAPNPVDETTGGGNTIVTYRHAIGTRLFFWLGLATLMLMAAPSAARAQPPGLFERGAQLVSGFGGSLSSDLEDESAGAERELDEATTFGGSYRYVLTPRISIEASVEYGRAESDGNGNGDENDDGDNGEDGENGDDGEDSDGGRVNVLNVSGSINVNLRRGGRFVPFVSAGGGVVSLAVSGAGTDSTLAGVFGAGLLFAVTDRWLVRADVRDYLYAASSVSTSTLQALMLPDRLTGVVNHLSATAGVAWRF